MIDLNTDWDHIAQEPETNLEGSATAENLAYMIYTSGSTGAPKGVQVEHRALVNYVAAAADTFALGPDDRILQFASISFDAAAEEIFPTLITGAALVLRTEAMLSTAPIFLAHCRALGITVLDLPTAYWHQLTAELAAQSLSVPDGLRLVIIGGERALPERVETWRQQVGARVRLLNTYGPTEATVVATAWDATESAPVREVPIGRPVRNVQAYILDRAGNPVPVGVAGELHLGGAGLARGYLGRPELTAERFIPNPFVERGGEGERGRRGASEDGGWRMEDGPWRSAVGGRWSVVGGRLYRTGDLCRFLPNGAIEYLGRIDQQVKVRGFRIELGEIEVVLGRHPQVREAVVVAREDVPGVRRLVAYVVPATEDGGWKIEDGRAGAHEMPSSILHPPSSILDNLRTFLKERLPDYMVPATFVVLGALPLTPSGKVDRKGLPAPDQARSVPDAAYVAPGSSVEQTLAGIWAQVLGVEHVGVNDNFFALGGDSILSIQVISRANQAGLRLTPKHLFQASTVGELAKLVGTTGAAQAEQGPVAGAVPLTPIQHWFFEQEFAEPHYWNQSLLLAARQPLDLEQLRRTVELLLAHHDALRLRFDREAGDWRQDNAGMGGDVPVSWFDLTGLAEPEQRQMIESTAAALQASLNLADGPLLRVAYFDQGQGRPGRLLLVVHHLAVDGVSWRILLEDLQTVYRQLERGAAVQLPPKTTSFRSWAHRLAEYARSDAVRAELDYWLAAARGRVARLPVDYQGGANTEGSARGVTVELSAEETRALLQDVPAVYRTEINDVLMAALALACSAWTGTRAVLVELEGHGREDLFDDIDISRTVGWFTTAFPVRLELPEGRGLGESLKAVKEQLRRIPNRGIGYGLLRYLSNDTTVSEGMRALPPAEISFNYLGQTDQVLREDAAFGPATEDGGSNYSPLATRGYLLDINGAIAGDRLQMQWTYSEHIHRRATVERVAQEFIAALRGLIAHCKSPDAGGYTPSDFSLAKLDQRKLDKVLAKFNKKERSSR